MPLAIKVENLGKAYQLGAFGKKSIWGDLFKKTNEEELFWALNDVTFDVEQGEVVGLIGKNGAGKSTLLKLLSRITSPSKGTFKVNGKLASLLEVGTGFHPELTGRENLFLNGAILGMEEREIAKKFDEIVDFSGVGKFIDTPVKRYSSGMYVRLAFSVAAHLEPEVMIVDEVLAVGDADFQKKCLGKLKDVSGAGRTVIFVSHNMAAIENLCTRGIFLKDGKILNDGPVKSVVNDYYAQVTSKEDSGPEFLKRTEKDLVKLIDHQVYVDGTDPAAKENFTVMKPIRIDITFELLEPMGFNFSLFLASSISVPVFNSISPIQNLQAGVHKASCLIPGDLLNDGGYKLDILFAADRTKPLLRINNLATFEVFDQREEGEVYFGDMSAYLIRPKLEWEFSKA